MSTTVEFARWSETSWQNKDLDWKKAKLITAGVDVGSVSSKAVVLADNEMVCRSCVYTGANSFGSAERALNVALEGTGMKWEDIRYIVGTGYGRVNIPFAHKTVTEIACHAMGCHSQFPSVRTILDMGGQDCKAISCDENGKVTEFLMNDKCAAGTGRSMEVLGSLLSVPVEEIGQRSLDISGEPPVVNNICVVFAKSETLSLLRKGYPLNDILGSYCDSLARRVATLMQRITIEPDFTISGGIAKNIGVVKRVEKLLGIEAKIADNVDPVVMGALGAAQFAVRIVEKQQAQAGK